MATESGCVEGCWLAGVVSEHQSTPPSLHRDPLAAVPRAASRMRSKLSPWHAVVADLHSSSRDWYSPRSKRRAARCPVLVFFRLIDQLVYTVLDMALLQRTSSLMSVRVRGHLVRVIFNAPSNAKHSKPGSNTRFPISFTPRQNKIFSKN